LKICDHNLRDILGLASLFACLCAVAAEPRKAREKYRADGERLALFWSYAARQGRADPELARDLLEAAAGEGYPRACRRLAMELEWGRGQDLSRALALTERALEGSSGKALGEGIRRDLENRRERLLKKIGSTKRSAGPG
jgi:TPR repeat protein